MLDELQMVLAGEFPEPQHTYAIPEDELAEFEGALAEHARR